MRKFLTLLCVLFCLTPLVALTCCGEPTKPTPLPSASPTSQPPPPPILGPLRAQGGRFVNQQGEVVRLRGVSYVPPDAKVYGWPSFISHDKLKEIADAGGNFVAVRLGPFTRDGEGIEYVAYESVGDLSRVNLDQWNPSYWSRVRSFAEDALSLGIYIEFDAIDAWVLERPELSPWSKQNNVNGYDGGSCDIIRRPIDYRQQQWLNKIAEELGSYPNVLFQISNESGAGNCQGLLNPVWEISVFNGLKNNLRWRGQDYHPIGTNSHSVEVEEYVDYVERHSCDVPSLQVGRPVGVNEWDCALRAEDFCRIQSHLGEGQWFILWGDGLSEGEWKEALKCLRQ